MTPTQIHKTPADWRVPPLLPADPAPFSWEEARAWVDGLPGGGGLNIAHEAVDRHADRTARPSTSRCAGWAGTGSARTSRTRELRRRTNRFANVLGALGVGRGDVVFVLSGRVPELYVAALGTLKAGCVVCPLFSAFGPEPMRQRIELGEGRVLVTTGPAVRAQGRRACATGCPACDHVLLVDVPGDADAARRHAQPGRPDGRGVGRFAIAADRPGGPGAAALHQRHHRHAEGRDARARGGRGPPRDRPVRPRPAPRRRLLVHRRPRLGDRHVLRHHRAADRTA